LPGAPLADAELAEHRGGFSLPNGIDVALAVQTQTRVDGDIVLRTVFTVDDGPARFAAYVPTSRESAVAEGAGRRASTSSVAPVISFDNRGQISLAPGIVVPGVSARPGAQKISSEAPDGFVSVAPGAPSQMGTSTIQVASEGTSYVANLRDTMLSITHMAGRSFGSIVENSSDNRAIDVETTIDLSLSGASPDLVGSALLRVESAALDALMARSQ